MKSLFINDEINLPYTDDEVGVIVSGGADSAILLFLLMKLFKSKIYIFTCISAEKNFANYKSSHEVVKKCHELNQCQNFNHYFYSVDKQDISNLFEFPISVAKERKISLLFSGITANPPADVLDSFKVKSKESQFRDPLINRSTTTHSDGVTLCTPFTNINKRQIAKIYELFDVKTELFPVTRSCESFEKIYSETHCGACWWCEERFWGFGSL